MSDWNDAVDPVQRREFTPAEKRRQRLTGWNASPQAVPTFVDPDFDKAGE